MRKHNEQDVLHSPFDMKIHAETFINYLEVVIHKNGLIEYAVPSHQRKCENILMLQKNYTYDELVKACPPEFYCDYNNWLCIETGTIMVWNDFYMGVPNDKQVQKLIELLQAGLYKGQIDVDRFESHE